jgi:hypothetical protein
MKNNPLWYFIVMCKFGLCGKQFQLIVCDFLWLKSKFKTRWTPLSIAKNAIVEDGEREFD